MTPWHARSTEERTLLNPAFGATLLWHAAAGYAAERAVGMAIELSFLVFPFVLHRETRGSLPRAISTSLATWLAEQPLVRTRLAERATALKVFTRESLLFGSSHGLLEVQAAGVRATSGLRGKVGAGLKLTSAEVRDCAKRAEFLGRWFDKGGDPKTVMTLLGVRP